MPNFDLFACALCRAIVKVEKSDDDVFVSFDGANGGWRIICDTCVVMLKSKGIPFMKINFGMLKEKSRVERAS